MPLRVSFNMSISRILFVLIAMSLALHPLSGQDTVQDRMDQAYQEHMCSCLEENAGNNDASLIQAFRSDCFRSFQSGPMTGVLANAISKGEVQDPKGDEKYGIMRRKYGTQAQLNSVNLLIDNCELYRKALIAIRDASAKRLTAEYKISDKWTAKGIREQFEQETDEDVSVQLYQLGLVYHTRGLFSKALNFYKEAYELKPTYRIKGFIRIAERDAEANGYSDEDSSDGSETAPGEVDLGALQKETDAAFVDHHCECLSDYADGSPQELYNAYQEGCYASFIKDVFFDMTKSLGGTADYRKQKRGEIMVQTLSNTAATLVDECKAYRQVLRLLIESNKDAIDFTHRAFEDELNALKAELVDQKPQEQEMILQNMGLYFFKNTTEYDKAISFLDAAYKVNSKSRNLAFIRMVERKRDGLD